MFAETLLARRILMPRLLRRFPPGVVETNARRWVFVRVASVDVTVPPPYRPPGDRGFRVMATVGSFRVNRSAVSGAAVNAILARRKRDHRAALTS
ncbi:hypothetical protein GCM10010140_10110 [Streptosporangium pseudovulgare]|uniref:DUF5655 domain-containing protein n=1 Tax=Streptosporangium pseudovulgare TaxID=35765 RepID=A0ABQ2QJB1_9ACTN|nr:hypothetical protein GCM10010140_10110 [Streptosporangium pseudovulgare]